MSDEELYQARRRAAVSCGDLGPNNCRHEWNYDHPDDPITLEEQIEWVDRMLRDIGDTEEERREWVSHRLRELEEEER